MKTLFLAAIFAFGLLIGAAQAVEAPLPEASPVREVAFHVAAPCECAGCVFDMQRNLKKFAGVQKLSLDAKKHCLTVRFDEHAHTVSELALAFADLDLGQKSELEWPIPTALELKKAAQDLAALPGVHSAVADPKTHVVRLTFAPKPTVTFEKLIATTTPTP